MPVKHKQLNTKLRELVSLSQIQLEADNIYSSTIHEHESFQKEERIVRENDAAREYKNPKDYLKYISTGYSIPVMDKEVERFLNSLPINSLILDIGGCFGWHWRKLSINRPDVGLIIVDFVRNNLRHAKKLLGDQIGSNIILVHANALSLPFPTAGIDYLGFDGVWTVQVFQHIPDFKQACTEVHRVLKDGGVFVCYSIQATPWIRLLYKIFRKKYHFSGLTKPGAGQMYLDRPNKQQERLIGEIFRTDSRGRYTECFFHPDVRITFSGKENSLVGKFDAWFGGKSNFLNKLLARQKSYEVTKNPHRT